MRNEILNINSDVKIEIYRHYRDINPDLYFTYINEDSLRGNSEVAIPIPVSQAKEIIEFLQSYVDEVEKNNA